MHPSLINPAVVGYICAMGLALAYLVQRHELVHRLAVLATLAAWAVHTVALIVRAVELGAPPLGSLSDAISVAVWVIVAVEMMIEQRSGLRVLGAFVLPIVVLLSLKATTSRPAGTACSARCGPRASPSSVTTSTAASPCRRCASPSRTRRAGASSSTG